MAEHDNVRNCTGPVSNLTDFVPLLQYLPNSFTMRAKQLHKDIVETYGGMINQIEQRIDSGEDVPHCLAKKLIEMNDRETSGLDRLDKVMICAAFMVGGVESVRDNERLWDLSSKIGLIFCDFRRLPSYNGSPRSFRHIQTFREELTLSLIVLLVAIAYPP